MKLKKSPLILKDFFVLDYHFNFIQPIEEDQFENRFEDYTIDFDFMTKTGENKETLLFTKIGINTSDNPAEGFSIIAESLTVLEIDEKSQLAQKDKGDLLYFSGLGIAINSLRNFIANMTSYSPMGKYILPSVDLNAIHEDKFKEIEAEKKAKNKKASR